MIARTSAQVNLRLCRLTPFCKAWVFFQVPKALCQSGETADTVEAARLASSLGAKVVAVTNAPYSLFPISAA